MPLSLVGVLAVTACAPAEDDADSAADGSALECTPDSMETLEEGTLTVGTSTPAYPPWFVDDDPENGEGFESAVAYAIAAELGYDDGDVRWASVEFNNAIQPGPKEFDFNVNQFSITEDREEAVDFSSPYYEVRQAVVALEGSEAAEAESLADLAEVDLGAQVGTTSYHAVEELIEPADEPQVFNTNDDGKLALENEQIDAFVVDLPTAFYITSAELDDGMIVGQLPALDSDNEEFGAVLDKDSPLTDCVTAAVDTLREDGTLADLEQEWLAEVADAPELS
ncbi:ABC transporter substrate-binding protein [Spiractinospora alimapuensis]|uniref:ABC transporter substrate-binding protein n=1 Tax=Spiractinospora alimapuensis TaxID=2820884 RepID=UPI001F1C384A|nr:ABC transporter substrate-binding protein [Spiractinospora alimapuensis]